MPPKEKLQHDHKPWIYNGILRARYASAMIVQSHHCGSNYTVSDFTEGHTHTGYCLGDED